MILSATDATCAINAVLEPYGWNVTNIDGLWAAKIGESIQATFATRSKAVNWFIQQQHVPEKEIDEWMKYSDEDVELP